MMGTADIRHLVLAFNKEGATNKQKAELTKVCAKIIKCRQKFLGSARKVVNQKTGGGYRNGGLVGFGTWEPEIQGPKKSTTINSKMA